MESYQDEVRLTVGEAILEEPSELDQISDAAYLKNEETLSCEPQDVVATTEEDDRKSPGLPKEYTTEVHHDEVSVTVVSTNEELPIATLEAEYVSVPAVDIEKPDVDITAAVEPIHMEAYSDEKTVDAAADVPEDYCVMEMAVSAEEQDVLTHDAESDVALSVMPVEAVPKEIHVDTEISKETTAIEERPVEKPEDEIFPAVVGATHYVDDVEISEEIGVVKLSDAAEQEHDLSSPVAGVEIAAQAEPVAELRHDELHVDSVHEITEQQIPSITETVKEDVGSFLELPEQQEVSAPLAQKVETHEPIVAVDKQLVTEEPVGVDVAGAAEEFVDVAKKNYEHEALKSEPDTESERSEQVTAVLPSDAVCDNEEKSLVIDKDATVEMPEAYLLDVGAAEPTIVSDISQTDVDIITKTLPEMTVEDRGMEELQEDQTATVDDVVVEMKITTEGQEEKIDDKMKAAETIIDATDATSEVTVEQIEVSQPDVVISLENISPDVNETDAFVPSEAPDVIEYEPPRIVEPHVEEQEAQQIEQTSQPTVALTTDTNEPITAELESADRVFDEKVTIDPGEKVLEYQVEEIYDQQVPENEKEISTPDERSDVEKLKSEDRDEEDGGLSMEDEGSFGYGFHYVTIKGRRTKIVRTISEDGEITEVYVSTDEDEESSVVSSRDSSVGDPDDVGMDIPCITVYASTVEGEPEIEPGINEYEDLLPDGSVVRRRVISTRCRQTITNRIVLDGLDDDETRLDDVFSTLSPVAGIPTDDGCRLVTRYSDRSSTGPEVRTEVQRSEGTLPDGTRVPKQVITMHSHQLTTDRLMVTGTRLFVEGGADDEDEVFDSLRRIGSPTPSTGTTVLCMFQSNIMPLKLNGTTVTLWLHLACRHVCFLH